MIPTQVSPTGYNTPPVPLNPKLQRRSTCCKLFRMFPSVVLSLIHIQGATQHWTRNYDPLSIRYSLWLGNCWAAISLATRRDNTCFKPSSKTRIRSFWRVFLVITTSFQIPLTKPTNFNEPIFVYQKCKILFFSQRHKKYSYLFCKQDNLDLFLL